MSNSVNLGMTDEETVKYLKKKDSSKSKSVEKSDHKHIYGTCLLAYKDYFYSGYDHIAPYKYCEICGKIKSSSRVLETIKIEGEPAARLLTQAELLERHKDEPCFRGEPFRTTRVNFDTDRVDVKNLKLKFD